MATAREHMQADLIYLFAQDGEGIEELQINGSTVRVFPGPEETLRGQFERENVITKQLYHLPGAMDTLVPDQLVDVGGVRWQVVSHILKDGLLFCLSIERSVG